MGNVGVSRFPPLLMHLEGENFSQIYYVDQSFFLILFLLFWMVPIIVQCTQCTKLPCVWTLKRNVFHIDSVSTSLNYSFQSISNWNPTHSHNRKCLETSINIQYKHSINEWWKIQFKKGKLSIVPFLKMDSSNLISIAFIAVKKVAFDMQ